ncbi:hypothetical protein JHK87_004563 [Glycine soja]|nr:hypothetical protein JHK87_004563 [Glycine soja]
MIPSIRMNKNKHNYYSNNQSNRVLNIKSSIPGGKTILRKQNTDQTRYRTRGKNKCGKILLLQRGKAFKVRGSKERK